jgi:membrane-associated phospholipid phosphatase
VRFRLGALAVAIVCAALVVALGYAVGRSPDPGWLMIYERAWVNHSTLIAWWLTWGVFPLWLVPLCLVLLVTAVRFPAWRSRIAVSIIALLLAWRGDALMQHVFMRPRRLDWVVKHETSFSYPSSHAAISVGFYGLWAFMLARSSLRSGKLIALVLVLLAIGIMWSRLALGAHYLSDIAGGALWGVAVVAALATAVPGVFARARRGSQLAAGRNAGDHGPRF